MRADGDALHPGGVVPERIPLPGTGVLPAVRVTIRVRGEKKFQPVVSLTPSTHVE
jgi:hypothetical protein